MLYTGIDIIELERIEHVIKRHGERFLDRVFTEAERELCGGRIGSLAARFAAKEAIAKLLGVGLRGLGAGDRGSSALGFREIEIRRDAAGRPTVALHGRAAARAAELNLGPISLSLSHTRLYAVASAVAQQASV